MLDEQHRSNETTTLLSNRDKTTYTTMESSTEQVNNVVSVKRRHFCHAIGICSFVAIVASIPVVIHPTSIKLLQSVYESFLFGPVFRYHHHRHIVYHQLPSEYSNIQSTCRNDACFQPPHPDNDTPQVATNRIGFPSYWNYANGKSPIDVSYDERSMLLNGQRSLFVGGSMHPTRATPHTWELALDKAVENGLNLITIYVMWAAHQPTANSTLDWNLTPKPISRNADEWSISSAIRSASKRGLFVHVRIGPFVCAEYNYGGIPEWLPLLHPDMEMRSLDSRWMDLMEQYIKSIVLYLQKERLFAYQGGPIIMAQIENEINGDIETGVKLSNSDILLSHDRKKDTLHSRHSYSKKVEEKSEIRYPHRRSLHARSSSHYVNDLQDYAEWCGQIAAKIAPDVVWTMCNGLTASNTVETYNGQFFDTWWLENYGASHRIQVDRPALWTEHEGGFQIWGDDPTKPSDYFWGETARAMSYSSIRWFARGGSHINYYMFWGGYNRERAAGGGITNAYAMDAILCPSGQRHQPKFDHFADLANVMAKHAYILLNTNSALGDGEYLYIKDASGRWIRGDSQMAFYYVADDDRGDSRELVFAENSSPESYTVKIPVGTNWRRSFTSVDDVLILNMAPYSAIVIVDGYVRFDSAYIDSDSKSYVRKYQWNPVELQNWTFIPEPIGVTIDDSFTVTSQMPIEQTQIHSLFNVSSDYAWFETSFTLNNTDSFTISIDTDSSTAFVVYIDGAFRGQGDFHFHKDDNKTVHISIDRLELGFHTVSILCESLGYYNVLGSWHVSSRAKRKGITGRVVLSSSTGEVDLTDGRMWNSYPNLHLSPLQVSSMGASTRTDDMGPLWTVTSFYTPSYDATAESLFLSIRSGRGHVWLNGIDLGRYWNVTRIDGKYTQEFYQLPDDYLHHDKIQNTLVFFDVFGSNLVDMVSLLLSSIEVSTREQMEDEIDFPISCI